MYLQFPLQSMAGETSDSTDAQNPGSPDFGVSRGRRK